MKKRFITDIKAGDRVDDIFVLSEKILSQKRDGNNFLNVTLSDKTGTIKGVVWDNVDQIAAGITSGDFAHVNGSVSDYRGTLQVVIKKMEPISPDRIDPSDFLPQTSRDIEGMFERLMKITDTINNRLSQSAD